MIDPKLVRTHRYRELNLDHPVLRGLAQHPDMFFQAREALNRVYAAVQGAVARGSSSSLVARRPDWYSVLRSRS